MIDGDFQSRQEKGEINFLVQRPINETSEVFHREKNMGMGLPLRLHPQVRSRSVQKKTVDVGRL